MGCQPAMVAFDTNKMARQPLGPFCWRGTAKYVLKKTFFFILNIIQLIEIYNKLVDHSFARSNFGAKND
jgi:hypothetical protein